MDILHFCSGEAPHRLQTLSALPDQGYVWIDLVRDEAEGWPALIEPLVGASVDVEHVNDSFNAAHPSFFDGTADYDMLIFEGLGLADDPFPLQTRVGAFFVFDRLLVTVRPSDGLSYVATKQRLNGGRGKSPPTLLALVHLILDIMVDRYLQVRGLLDSHLTEMQDQLLTDPGVKGDWKALLQGRREARRLESLSENQLEALDAWRRNSRFEWNSAEEVRLHDLIGHVDRVYEHASALERDVEAAVQLHFASVSHRTNQIIQTLTVVSVVFFPLSLITGIYGMNFEYMPELHWRYGYFMALGALLGIGVVLLLLFRRRGYF